MARAQVAQTRRFTNEAGSHTDTSTSDERAGHVRVEVKGVEPSASAVRRPFWGVWGPGRTGLIGPLNCGFGPQRISAIPTVSQRDAGRMRDEIGPTDGSALSARRRCADARTHARGRRWGVCTFVRAPGRNRTKGRRVAPAFVEVKAIYSLTVSPEVETSTAIETLEGETHGLRHDSCETPVVGKAPAC
jgi:hypothetical protein